MTTLFVSSSKDPAYQPTVLENLNEHFDVGNAENSSGIEVIDCSLTTGKSRLKTDPSPRRRRDLFKAPTEAVRVLGRTLVGSGIKPELRTSDLVFFRFDLPSLIPTVHPYSP